VEDCDPHLWLFPDAAERPVDIEDIDKYEYCSTLDWL